MVCFLSVQYPLMVCLTVLNWCALDKQCFGSGGTKTLLIHNVHANSTNAGLLLVPVWARKGSQLYHNQDTMLRSLGMNTCDFSQQASLLFNKKVDVREHRPLNYPVRIINGFQDSEWDAVWKNVGLVQNTYSAFAAQVQLATPSSCWEREAQVHGAKKAELRGWMRP